MKVELTPNGALLSNDHVRLELIEEGQRLMEYLQAWDGEAWVPVVTSAPGASQPPDFVPEADTVTIQENTTERVSLRLEGTRDAHRFSIDISLARGARWIEFQVRDEIVGTDTVRSLQSRYCFAEPDVDFCFAPHLRPDADHVVGQFAFKSPAAIIQRGGKLAALLPDLALLGRHQPMPVALEPDVSPCNREGPSFAYGLKNHEPTGLVYFRHGPEMTRDFENAELVYGYRLYISALAEPHYGYREIVHLLWELYGRHHVAKVAPQVIPFDRYAAYALDYATDALWRELPQDGESRGGFVMGIKFPNDIWFHFFFNHLHTAYGLYQLGRRWQRDDIVAKAIKIRNLALSAPAQGGFPSAIFSHEIVTGMRRDRWVTHAHWVGGSIPYQTQIAGPLDLPAYSTMDASWTCYWMLRWHSEIEPDERLLGRARDYAEQLLQIQRPSGSIPVFVDRETLAPLLHLSENPSAAAAGLFLAKMHEVTHDVRYLQAAREVAAFLDREVMPQRWCDYESLYDSAGKPADLFDRYTRQGPQNTFPIYWTAELCKLLYRLTHDEALLEQACRAVDYLLLFQGVWSPPYLSVKGFGSIGIGNGHTGWNDARSGIFAPGIADFFFLTGNIEYLERSVAAMRAPLALMYIPENQPVSAVFDQGPLGYADECYAHRGRDTRLGPSCFDFSVGYSLVSFSELWSRLGSVCVNVPAERAVGVDGYCVVRVAVRENDIELDLRDGVGMRRELVVMVHGAGRNGTTLTVNGTPAELLASHGETTHYLAHLAEPDGS